jgi:hypothetical protein
MLGYCALLSKAKFRSSFGLVPLLPGAGGNCKLKVVSNTTHISSCLYNSTAQYTHKLIWSIAKHRVGHDHFQNPCCPKEPSEDKFGTAAWPVTIPPRTCTLSAKSMWSCSTSPRTTQWLCSIIRSTTFSTQTYLEELPFHSDKMGYFKDNSRSVKLNRIFLAQVENFECPPLVCSLLIISFPSLTFHGSDNNSRTYETF